MADRRATCPTLLRQLIDYNPDTGDLTWRPRPLGWFKRMGARASERHAAWNSAWAGKPAMQCVGTTGYRRGRLFNRDFFAHRVAFLIMTGRTPDMIDHVNHDRTDNRWCNLREASATENARNTSSNAGSTSRFLGVFWSKKARRWCVKIKHDGKVVTVGHFASELEAAKAYDARATAVFGEFANLNFPRNL